MTQAYAPFLRNQAKNSGESRDFAISNHNHTL